MSTRTSRPLSRYRTMALAATALLGAACADNVKTDFPPGLDPLDAVNLATCPAGTTLDPYPEALAFHSTTVDQVVHSYACGHIQRPVAEVWAAGTDPQTSAEAPTSVDACSIALGVETGYDHSWFVHSSHSELGITIWFDVTWRSGTLPWPTPAGGPPEPLTVAWRFRKTNGTAYIQLMDGSVKAYEVAPGITRMEFIRFVNAARSPPDVVESGIQNHYDNILAKLNSTPFTNRPCAGP